MSEVRESRLLRLLAELAVIVAGVLLALAADSAWEARGDRQREAALVADLLAEFQENESRLVSDIEANRRYREAARQTVTVIHGNISIPQDSLAIILSQSLRVTRFDPVEGAIRSVVDAGQLQLIESRDLRQALAGWPGLVDERRLGSEYSAQVMASITPDALRLQPKPSLDTWELTVLTIVEAFGEGRVEGLEALLEELRQILVLLEIETAT